MFTLVVIQLKKQENRLQKNVLNKTKKENVNYIAEFRKDGSKEAYEKLRYTLTHFDEWKEK